jgi:effector-binding domain-containing protein
MIDQPRFEIRATQYYVAKRIQTERRNLTTEAPKILADVSKWLQKNRIAPGGPPLIRYWSINGEMVDVDIGVATSEPAGGDRKVEADSLPRGRYLTVIHRGPYETLVNTTAEFLDWAKGNNVVWDNSEGPRGTSWRARVEHYLTDPEEQPNPMKWETKLSFLTRG